MAGNRYGALTSWDLGQTIDDYKPGSDTTRPWGVTGRLVSVRHTLESDEYVTRLTVELGDGQRITFAADSGSHLNGDD